VSEWGKQLDLFNVEDGFPEPDPSTILKIENAAVEIMREAGLKVSSIRWKNNRRVMASVGKHGVLNLNNIYKRAEKKDLMVLSRVLTGKSGSKDSASFEKFIERHLPLELVNGKSRLVINPPAGLFHDLDRAIRRLLPLLDLPPDPLPRLGWSPARVGRQGITWGTHRETPNGPLILLNAILDAPDVPGFVIEHILWHELCHQVAPPIDDGNGRRQVHSKKFKELENRYPRKLQAENWEQTQVGKLIRRHTRKYRLKK